MHLAGIKKFVRFADKTAAELELFVCGANKTEQHRAFSSWSDVGGLPKVVDIRKAKPGDQCFYDNKQFLIEKRGIEVGHIFQLGRKYSSSLEANFTNEKGSSEPFWMGCYGIGVSRIAQAAVEQSHDQSGIIWPLSISPFEVIIVIANIKDEVQNRLGEDIYKQLRHKGIDVLLDDRDERAGVKFKDADLIGIPWRVVVGRDSSSGKVELLKRSDRSVKLIESEIVVKELIAEISRKKSSISY